MSILPETIELKINLREEIAHQLAEQTVKTFRSDSIEKTGFLKGKLIFGLEAKQKKILLDKIPWNELQGFNIRPLSRSEVIEEIDFSQSSITKKKKYLDFGHNVMGVIRLYQ